MQKYNKMIKFQMKECEARHGLTGLLSANVFRLLEVENTNLRRNSFGFLYHRYVRYLVACAICDYYIHRRESNILVVFIAGS